MKVINYSRLNTKNKARVDQAIARFDTRPKIVHHSVMSTYCTKFVRSMVTVSDPTAEVNIVLGGRIKQTQIAIDR